MFSHFGCFMALWWAYGEPLKTTEAGNGQIKLRAEQMNRIPYWGRKTPVESTAPPWSRQTDLSLEIGQTKSLKKKLNLYLTAFFFSRESYFYFLWEKKKQVQHKEKLVKVVLYKEEIKKLFPNIPLLQIPCSGHINSQPPHWNNRSSMPRTHCVVS